MPFFKQYLRVEADPQPSLPAPYVVVANHVTELDFFFAAAVFRAPMTFVAGEALLRVKILGWLLTRVFGCIVKQKGAADARTTMGMLRRLREGRNVCLFAEGNTTFDGRTNPIPEATGAMLRAVGAGLVTCRIEGGYFTMPRWGKGIRRGRTAVRVAGTYTREQLQAMGTEDINALLQRDLREDAYDRQGRDMTPFRGKNPAGGIGRVLYLCPKCKGQSTLSGEGDLVTCSACGVLARYTEYGTFEGDKPFHGIREWADWQKEELRRLAGEPGAEAVLRDAAQRLSVHGADGELTPVAEGTMEMGRGSLRVGGFAAPLPDIVGLEVYRRNTLQFTLKDGRHFEAVPSEGFNALKYRDLYRILKGLAG
ncbi:MAG TPA: lysophospholipid acyltransferase family protein [Candidatus Limnocylindria bacterium]|nr:lysophospholipid acyltransferase family protein [Candidatus Limnocylindria bacterium]